MKQSLRLNMGQQLTLTPQLQLAIRLLQLSTLDLNEEIQLQVESNPMLDLDLNEDDEDPLQNTVNTEEFSDFQWENLYTSHSQEDAFHQENMQPAYSSLQDHLRWQLELTPMTDVDRMIATAIIDAITDDGLLSLSLIDLHESLNSKTHPLDITEIDVVRHRIQQFDPIGCGALNLAEVLLIQLKSLPKDTPCLALTQKIIKEHLPLLGKHQYLELMKMYHIDELTLKNIQLLVHQLNPKPGNNLNHNPLDYITPDLIVKKTAQMWQVTLNPRTLPSLSINQYYSSLLNGAHNENAHQFLKNNLQEARWFLKSIQSRQETLLKVARYIVDYQKDFLEYGAEAMKPLILNEVACALNLHESTVSRVTTQKYIYTPRGLFELRYFFSSHVSTCIGGECSSTAIRAVIKKLIAAENCKHPLSDSKLVELLSEQGVTVARRTIAKYRDAMGIAPSRERKSISG